jgi:hypothetical protein
VSSPIRPQDPIDAVVQYATSQLASVDPSPFSADAFEVLKQKVADYVRAVVTESMKMAKRHDADTISPTYVEDANRLLVSSSGRRWIRHLGTLGGILLGAALSNLLAMTTAEKYSAVAILVTAGLGIVGAFMIALHIARD